MFPGFTKKTSGMKWLIDWFLSDENTGSKKVTRITTSPEAPL